MRLSRGRGDEGESGMQQSAVNQFVASKKRIHKKAGVGFLAPMPALDSLLGSLRGCLERFPDKCRGMNTI